MACETSPTDNKSVFFVGGGGKIKIGQNKVSKFWVENGRSKEKLINGK